LGTRYAQTILPLMGYRNAQPSENESIETSKHNTP
jgi:hypothetical protein